MKVRTAAIRSAHWWRAQPRVHRVCYVVAAVLIASGLAHLGVAALSDRPWAGPLSWRKAVTFGISFGVTLASIAWVVSLVPGASRTGNWLLTILAADCVIEVFGVTLQAWRHVPSHVNRETAFDSAISTMLAAGGGVLIVVISALAAIVFRASGPLSSSMRVAVCAGFAILFPALVSGAAMIARGVTGEVVLDGTWDDPAYAQAGFLKMFHGVTLRAVLVLPGVGVLLSGIRLRERTRILVMVGAVAVYVTSAAAVLAWELTT